MVGEGRIIRAGLRHLFGARQQIVFAIRLRLKDVPSHRRDGRTMEETRLVLVLANPLRINLSDDEREPIALAGEQRGP
jgi:hypothetical protein